MLAANASIRVVALNVTHNIEMAHRLYTLPGKCQNIHGHSMQVTLELAAHLDDRGYAIDPQGDVLEFGQIKKDFRTYLDTMWDHHLHLNIVDPWAQALGIDHNAQGRVLSRSKLPGLVTWEGDPSTENVARWIFEYMKGLYPGSINRIKIAETGTNGVEYYG